MAIVRYVCDDGTSHAYGWSSLPQWAQSHAYTFGQMVRQLATPTWGNERVWMAVVPGTSGGIEPSWVTGNGGSLNDNGVTWADVTGQPAVNGDVVNTPAFATNTSYTNGTGRQIIKNTAGTHYFLCTTSGTSGGTEPAWSTVTNTATSSGTAWFLCIGAVGDFTAWGAPYAKILGAIAWAATVVLESIFVSHRHCATGAANVSTVSTQGYYFSVTCCNDSVAPPVTLATTASETVTGSYTMSVYGNMEIYGLTFTPGSGNGSVFGYQNNVTKFNSCNLVVPSGKTVGFGCAYNGSTGGGVYVKDSTITFGDSSSKLNIAGVEDLILDGVTIAGSPTYAFYQNVFGGTCGRVEARNCDFSSVSSYVFGNNYVSNVTRKILAKNCKMHASGTLFASSGLLQSRSYEGHNVGTTAVNHKYLAKSYEADITLETTQVRTSGANNGGGAYSIKCVTTAYPLFLSPGLLPEIASKWNLTTGSSVTATIEINSSATLYDDDIWVEFEYLGDATSPKGSVTSTRRGLLATRAALPSSTATWPSGTCQKLTATFTPQLAGPIVARVYVAKPSATIYIDPMITLS